MNGSAFARIAQPTSVPGDDVDSFRLVIHVKGSSTKTAKSKHRGDNKWSDNTDNNTGWHAGHRHDIES